MNASDQHLSDDQLEALLLGDAASAATAHVAACSQCREEAMEFTSLIASFNQSSLDWSRSRSVQAPRQVPARERFRGVRLFSAPAYALAAVLLMLLTLAFSRFAPHPRAETLARLSPARQSSPTFKPVSSGQAPDAPVLDAQIAADNHLLADIDSALDQPDPTPVPSDLFFDTKPATSSAR